MSRSLAALALVALASGSCADYEIAEQDVGIRYDAEVDVLTIDLDSRGLHRISSGGMGLRSRPGLASSADALALGRITQVAGGARYMQFLGLPFAIELDALRKEVAEDGDVPQALSERWDALEKNVGFIRSGAYIDGAGEAAVYQRIRIAEAQDLIAWLDDVIDAFVLEDVGDTDNPDGKVAALHAFARDEAVSWVRLTATALEVSFPADAATRAEILRNVMGSPERASAFAKGERAPWEAEVEPAIARAILHDLGEVDFQGGIVVLRYPFGTDGAIDLPYRRSRAPELAAELVRGLRAVAAPELTREQVLGRLDSEK